MTQVGPAPAGSSGHVACRPRHRARRWSLGRSSRRSGPSAATARTAVPAGRRVGHEGDHARERVPGRSSGAELGSPAGELSQGRAGQGRHLLTSETKGNLPAKLNAQLAWVSARADRAWYALAHAHDRLRALGVDDDSIFAIDQASEPKFTPGERAAFAFARKLTVDPALIDDADFNGLKRYYSDSEIAELIYHVNHDVFFNRVTEAANLPLDGGPSGTVSRR